MARSPLYVHIATENRAWLDDLRAATGLPLWAIVDALIGDARAAGHGPAITIVTKGANHAQDPSVR